MYKIVFYNDEFINYEDLDIWQIILPDDIISIELDPYYANNDDPFEIVGRKAKITIIDLPQYEWLKDLQILEFPVMIYTPPELAHNPIPYCNEFFKNLVRIIDLNNNMVIFTGLIKRDGINYNIKEGTLEFEIYDSLYVWITASKIGIWNHTSPLIRLENIDNNYSIDNFFRVPTIFLSAPLNDSELEIDPNYNYLLNNFQMPLPECEILPRNWSWSDIFPDNPNAYNEWMRLSRLSFVWEWKSENSTIFDMVAISFISIYRSINQVSGGYLYKFKGYRLNYKKDNMMIYDSCFTYLSNEFYNLQGWATLYSKLATAKLIPPESSYSITNSAVGYSGLNYENIHNNIQFIVFTDYSFLDWIWQGDSFHINVILPNAGIPTASPQYLNFGIAKATFQTIPKYIEIENPDSAKMADIAKGLLIIYGLTMSAKPEGGIKISPHLIAKLATGEGLSDYIEINEEDVYEFSAEGIIYDLDTALGNLTVFKHSDFIDLLVKYRYIDFKNSIANNYHLSVARFYYDEFAWDNYRTILFRDKFLYVRAYSQLLKDDDIFDIDAIGS